MQDPSFEELWQQGNRGAAVAVVVVRDGGRYRMAGQLVAIPNETPAESGGEPPVALLVVHASGDTYFGQSMRLNLALGSLHGHTTHYGALRPEWRRLPSGWFTSQDVPDREPPQA